MGLYSSMRTSASGMNAQSNRISSVADNIANSNTTGYKRSSIEFSTLVLAQGGSDYQSGSVNSQTQYYISQQGAILPTSRWSNVAVQGDGFFVVQNPGGQTFLTRSGSFVPTEGTGYLENAAGMRLMGYPISGGATPPVVLNGIAGLQQIQLGALALASVPSTAGTFSANLSMTAGPPAGSATVINATAANLPSANTATAAPSLPVKSVTVFDNIGNEVSLDIYATRVPVAGAPVGTAYQWEVTVFDASKRGAGASFFPYAAGGQIGSDEFYFDNTGSLMAAGPQTLGFTVPGGQPFTLDLKSLSSNAADYAPDFTGNGNAPSQVTSYEISDDGILSAIYKNGSRVDQFKIPLAKVPSPDKLSVQAGNTFLTTNDSGDFQIGFANEGGRGNMNGGALEQSNADLANELTIMIEAQRNYSANSKVFQTSAELLDVLVNLSR